MINKVYLLWNSYSGNEMIVIGTLSQADGKYIFKYTSDALRAKELGCFLPFPYTEEELVFDFLPPFFDQRILKGKFNSEKFGVDSNDENKLRVLIYGNAVRNADNYSIISEDKYMKRR